MPAMQDMQPFFDAYQDEIKKAKNASGMTLQELSDKTGVPYNNICAVNAGTMKQPLLYYAAATCKVLDLSLDKLLGLSPGSDEYDRLRMENAVLKCDTEHYKKLGAIHKPLVLGLIGVCALLVCVVIGYICFDIRLKNAGLFKSGGMTALAVLLALIVLSAIALMVYALKTVIRDCRGKRDEVPKL